MLNRHKLNKALQRRCYMVTVYDSIDEQLLVKYAIQAGFGKDPFDLHQMKRFLKKGGKILEVGCGTGRLGKHLIKDFEYVGIDNHKPYLKCFRNYLIKQGIHNPDKYAICKSFMDYTGVGFFAVIFPWTVIGDFPRNKQALVLKKARDMIVDGGVILLDNPAIGTVYNAPKGYKPAKFYYYDWKDRFRELGFRSHSVYQYYTLTNRLREITLLRK